MAGVNVAGVDVACIDVAAVNMAVVNVAALLDNVGGQRGVVDVEWSMQGWSTRRG